MLTPETLKAIQEAVDKAMVDIVEGLRKEIGTPVDINLAGDTFSRPEFEATFAKIGKGLDAEKWRIDSFFNAVPNAQKTYRATNRETGRFGIGSTAAEAMENAIRDAEGDKC